MEYSYHVPSMVVGAPHRLGYPTEPKQSIAVQLHLQGRGGTYDRFRGIPVDDVLRESKLHGPHVIRLKLEERTEIPPPHIIKPADLFGMNVLRDTRLNPVVFPDGVITDGTGRILGHVLPTFHEDLDYFGFALRNRSDSTASITSNPYPPDEEPGTPANSIKSVYHRDIDLGVTPQAIPFGSTPGATAVIGVEASSYLQQLIDEPPSNEPLLAALGGDPISLKEHIEIDLDKWKEKHTRPLFVFDGLNVVGKNEVTLEAGKVALEKTNHAWNLYGENSPNEAVKAFGQSDAVRAPELYRILQEVLIERDLPYMVALYTAGAQLAYLLDAQDENGNYYIDAVMGSIELLLYEPLGNDHIILPLSTADWEKGTARTVSKEDIMRGLNLDPANNATPTVFADTLLMVGTSFLPTFPGLVALLDDRFGEQPPTVSLKDALNMLRTTGGATKSVTLTCDTFDDVIKQRDPNWLDKYRKAKMGLKHPVTLKVDGSIVTAGWENLTGDNPDYLGLQLPSELHFYLSKGIIGPRILNCFVSLQSIVFPTLDGVTSDEYKKLVTRTLVPVKETMAALIASRIHRAFIHKDIEMRFWFDDTAKQTLIHRNIQASTNSQADTWGVRADALSKVEKTVGSAPGTLSFALLALQTKDFPATTISKDKVTGLNSKAEVISNALWRLLHLRGYINDQHELTGWGRALATTMKSIGPIVKKYKDIHHVEEAAFLAFELLRFENLNSRNRHPELIGGPMRSSEEDKSNCILIGRTACLLKLRHEKMGYTGPLSKNFLAFHSIIKAVREIDRDLLEAVTASMFLSNQASRTRSDESYYLDLGRSLQFSADVDTALGIAVKTYLDDFLQVEWSPEQRDTEKTNYVARFLPHAINFKEDLDVAFNFFDAVYEGVKTLKDEIGEADKKAWDHAHEYLQVRR